MTILSKLALVLGFGSIMFSLFVVFNNPESLAQASRLEFPLVESLNDAASITMMLPTFLAFAATVVGFTQLRQDHGGTVFVLVALSWLVLIAVVGIQGVVPQQLR
jgi:hypothetical protein